MTLSLSMLGAASTTTSSVDLSGRPIQKPEKIVALFAKKKSDFALTDNSRLSQAWAQVPDSTERILVFRSRIDGAWVDRETHELERSYIASIEANNIGIVFTTQKGFDVAAPSPQKVTLGWMQRRGSRMHVQYVGDSWIRVRNECSFK